jgi:hypothetical protein
MSINKIIVSGLLFFVSCTPYEIINSETAAVPHEITNRETDAMPAGGGWKWTLIKYVIFGAVCYCAGMGKVRMECKALKQSNEFMAEQLRTFSPKLASAEAKTKKYESLLSAIISAYDTLMTNIADIQ